MAEITDDQDKEFLEYMTRKIKENQGRVKNDLEQNTCGHVGKAKKVRRLAHARVNYLKVRIENDGRDKKEVKQRVAQARRVVNQLNGICWSKEIFK